MTKARIYPRAAADIVAILRAAGHELKYSEVVTALDTPFEETMTSFRYLMTEGIITVHIEGITIYLRLEENS